MLQGSKDSFITVTPISILNKYQNVKQMILTLLEVFARAENCYLYSLVFA